MLERQSEKWPYGSNQTVTSADDIVPSLDSWQKIQSLMIERLSLKAKKKWYHVQVPMTYNVKLIKRWCVVKGSKNASTITISLK